MRRLLLALVLSASCAGTPRTDFTFRDVAKLQKQGYCLTEGSTLELPTRLAAVQMQQSQHQVTLPCVTGERGVITGRLTTPADNIAEIAQRDRGTRPASGAVALIFGGIATAVGSYAIASGQSAQGTLATASGAALLALGTYLLIPSPAHVVLGPIE
jgi:hypothetical protein